MSQWCFRYIHLPIFWDVTGRIHHSNHRSLSPCSSGVVVPSWQVMKMPDDMAFESAAALPTVVLTALHAVNLVPTSISSVAYRFCIQESIDSFQHFIKMVQVLYRCCICFDMLLFLRWILWNPHLRCESTKAGAPELLGRGPWPWNIVSKVLKFFSPFWRHFFETLRFGDIFNVNLPQRSSTSTNIPKKLVFGVYTTYVSSLFTGRDALVHSAAGQYLKQIL